MISIIITALNESELYLKYTVNSLRATIDEGDEIIIVDDYSDTPVANMGLCKCVKIHRNPFRLGVANSRHVGATLAKNPWLLFTDSHMIFAPNWRIEFEEYCKTAQENTIYNGTCLGLWDGAFNYNNIKLHELPHYYGARLSLWDEKDNQILEGKWINENKEEDNYEISCLMGAIYFIQRKFFFKIRGLSDLKMWGSDEPCLSLKTLLNGGEIRQLKKVKAAHVFRRSAPYNTDGKYLLYNKIRMAKTLLPMDMAETLISKLKNRDRYFEALDLINKENKLITEYQKYYYSTMRTNINEIMKKFNL